MSTSSQPYIDLSLYLIKVNNSRDYLVKTFGLLFRSQVSGQHPASQLFKHRV